MTLSMSNLYMETKGERIKREEEIRLQEESERTNWRKGRNEHAERCGHLMRREVEGESL